MTRRVAKEVRPRGLHQDRLRAAASFGGLRSRGDLGFFPRLARRAIRELLWPAVLLMEAGHRFGRLLLKTEYKVTGACKKRGACCHHVLLEWFDSYDEHPLLGRIALFKATFIHDFFDTGNTLELEDGTLARVMGCQALREDGSCGTYRLRPLLCRTFPEVPLLGKPPLLKGCGYDFERREVSERPLVQIGARRKDTDPHSPK